MQHYSRRQGFTCPITGKPGYPTYEASEKARKWLKSHNKGGFVYQLETYGPCPYCGQHHHTTSKPLGILAEVT